MEPMPAEISREDVDLSEWQVDGMKRAIAPLDRGEGVPHREVKAWVESWGGKPERPIPKH
jgi:RHH-type transcriptional regulator, rel operon repressor / antitoxin RelB